MACPFYFCFYYGSLRKLKFVWLTPDSSIVLRTTKFASQTKFASGELKAAMSGKVFSVIERKRDHSVADTAGN